jgi:alkaline phosphatase D
MTAPPMIQRAASESNRKLTMA